MPSVSVAHEPGVVAVEALDGMHRILDAGGVASVAIGTDGTVLRVNRHGCVLAGASENELIGSNWLEQRVAPSDRERVRRALEVSEPGPVTTLEYTFCTADGRERPLTSRITSLRAFDGQICGTLHLTPAVQLQEHPPALQDLGRAQATLVSASSLAIIALDSRGAVMLWNAAAERIFGWSAEEVIGLPNPIVPADRTGEFSFALERALRGESNEIESVRMAKDGRRLPVLISFAALRGADGVSYGALAMIADLTHQYEAVAQLHRAEERFQLLVDGAREYAMFMLDPNGIITTWNLGGERLKGYSAKEIIGQHISRFYTDEDRERGLPEQLLAAAARDGDAKHEGWRVRKDGYRFWASVVITAIRGEDRRLLGFSKITRDISERKAFQDTLQARARQQELVAELSQAVLAGTSLNELFTSAAAAIAECLAVERSAVLELVRDGASLLLRAGVGWARGVGTFVMPATREWQAGYSLRVRGPVIVTDYDAETRFTRSPLIRQYGVQSAITVALRHENDVLGVVAAYADEKRFFSHDEVRFVEAVARLLTTAIRHRTGETQLQRSEQRFRAQYQRLPIPTFTWQHIDQDFVLVDFNDAAHRFTGGSAASLVGGQASELYRDRADILEGMRRAFENRRSVRTEIEYDMPTTRRRHDLDVTYSFVAPDIVLTYVTDVTERRSREKQILASREELRSLSNRLIQIQEDERTRIAREVHDQLGQRMTTLKFAVAVLAEAVRPSSGEFTGVEEIYQLIDDTVDVARRIAAELRPPVLDDFGLVAAAQLAIEQFQARTAIECDMSVQPPDLEVPPAIATSLYRILQECLANVARHAGAQHVELRLRKDDHRLVLEVRDDGVGIAPGALTSKDSLGVLGIRERAHLVGGDVRFEGLEGHGTIVSISVPLPQDAP